MTKLNVKPKFNMNMSILLLGLVILLVGNIYYSYRQYNELNKRIENLTKDRPNIFQNIRKKMNKKKDEKNENQEKEINTLDLDNLDINIEEIENNEKVIDTNVNKVNILNEKSKKELMEIAENNELSKTGTKSELINRIVESEIELN